MKTHLLFRSACVLAAIAFVWVPMTAAAECIDPMRLLPAAERAAIAGNYDGARMSLGAMDEGFRCTPNVSGDTVARYWMLMGVIGVHDGQLEGADFFFAAAGRAAPELWEERYGDTAKRVYQAAQTRERQDGLVRLHPEHVQYNGAIDGIRAIFPLKVQSGLHFIQIRMTDGSDQQFSEFVMVPPRETLRVVTHMKEDVDRWVPVWLGGSYDADTMPRLGAAPPPPPPPPEAVEAPSDTAVADIDPLVPSTPADPPPPQASTAASTAVVSGGGSDLPEVDLTNATEVGDVTYDQYRFLKPKRHLLDPAPRDGVDFTAYALEWGEFKIGFGTVAIGILPRTHVGTEPVLWALGVQNGFAKFNPVRLGPFDLSATGKYYGLPLGDFRATYWGAGVQASLILAPAFSIHTAFDYDIITTTGVPDFSQLSPLLSTISGQDLGAIEVPADMLATDPEFSAELLTARVAMDLRFNRRDSIIVEGAFVYHAKIRQAYVDEDFLPPIAGLDDALKHDGPVPVSSTYVASISYQISSKQIDFRIGVGISAVQWAWVLQAMEFSYRFGGKTRLEERRMKKQWRRDKAGQNTDAIP